MLWQMGTLYLDKQITIPNNSRQQVLRIGPPGGQNLNLACGSHLQWLIHQNRQHWTQIQKFKKKRHLSRFSYSSLIENALPCNLNSSDWEPKRTLSSEDLSSFSGGMKHIEFLLLKCFAEANLNMWTGPNKLNRSSLDRWQNSEYLFYNLWAAIFISIN